MLQCAAPSLRTDGLLYTVEKVLVWQSPAIKPLEKLPQLEITFPKDMSFTLVVCSLTYRQRVYSPGIPDPSQEQFEELPQLWYSLWDPLMYCIYISGPALCSVLLQSLLLMNTNPTIKHYVSLSFRGKPNLWHSDSGCRHDWGKEYRCIDRYLDEYTGR